MADTLRVGILGAGWAGLAHARGYVAAGGYKLDSVCDLIPARVGAFSKEFPGVREAESVEAMMKDPGLDVISICLPTDLHALWGVKALRAKKHVVVETPPALDSKGMKALIRGAEKTGRVVLPAFQRHFGLHEAAARQAVQKGYIGDVYHARATWTRPAGIPQGTRNTGDVSGWYTDLARSGGGAFMDLGLPMLELAWSLLGYPKPESAMAVKHHALAKLAVEEAGSALIRFEGNRSLELGAAWTLRTSPSHYGLACRVHGTLGALDVYTAEGATLYRGEGDKLKATLLKGPKTVHYPALMRELKSLIANKEGADPLLPAKRGLTLQRMMEGIYKSAGTGKSVEVRD